MLIVSDLRWESRTLEKWTSPVWYVNHTSPNAISACINSFVNNLTRYYLNRHAYTCRLTPPYSCPVPVSKAFKRLFCSCLSEGKENVEMASIFIRLMPLWFAYQGLPQQCTLGRLSTFVSGEDSTKKPKLKPTSVKINHDRLLKNKQHILIT